MELDPRIEELLARITELSDSELEELRDLVMSAVTKELPEDPKAVVAAGEVARLETLANAVHKISTEETKRRNLSSRARVARQSLASLVPADRRPRFTTQGRASAVTASGVEINNGAALVAEIVNAVHQQRAPGRDGRTLVASVTSAADRPVLRAANSAEANAEALTAAATALVAAGGLGAAVEDTDYTLPGFETVDRPIKAALPGVTAERGGIRFMRSPTLADLAGSVDVWNLQTDESAALPDDPAATPPFVSPRKNILRVEGTVEVTVNTQAVTSRLQIGNLMTRAYPELVTRYVDLAAVAHARVAEQQLIASMDALSTQVTATGSLGAARVLLPTLDRAAVAMRDRLRAAPEAPVTVVLPAWTKGLLRSDLAMQHPGDSTLGVTDAELEAFFASRNIMPVYSLDTQNHADQAAGALLGWNANVKAWLHMTGSFSFMDGGTLDLGVVRDSALNAANDYELFIETFEALVQRVPASLAITVPVAASGASAAAV